MLYDPKWNGSDIFTLPHFISWLEKQPATETYCYLSHGACLLAQYLKASGFRKVKVFSMGSYRVGRSNKDYPLIFDQIAAEGSHTFGAALERAREELVSR